MVDPEPALKIRLSSTCAEICLNSVDAWMSETENREAAVLARCAKVFCTEAAEKVGSGALQVLGQQGFVRGNPAEATYRDAKHLQVAGTSSEISRIAIGDLLLEGR